MQKYKKISSLARFRFNGEVFCFLFHSSPDAKRNKKNPLRRICCALLNSTRRVKAFSCWQKSLRYSTVIREMILAAAWGGFSLRARTLHKASLEISNQSDKLTRRAEKNPKKYISRQAYGEEEKTGDLPTQARATVDRRT